MTRASAAAQWPKRPSQAETSASRIRVVKSPIIETTAFFRDVLGLSLEHEEPEFSMFRLPAVDRDYVEVFAASDPDVSFYSAGPGVGLLVDGLEEARATLEGAGVEMLDEMHWPETMEGYGWFHFRGPDGNVYAVLEGSELVGG